MTEKRFEIIESAVIDGARVIKDNEKKYTFATTFETATLINYRKALNELNDEKNQLETDLDYHKAKCGSLEVGMFNLERENEQLKSKNRGLQSELQIFKEDVTHSNLQINKLADENGQLKQRNNRQAKQLDRLYNLIEEKDWRTLTDIIDDFKRCEEQLQREWKCYDD